MMGIDVTLSTVHQHPSCCLHIMQQDIFQEEKALRWTWKVGIASLLLLPALVVLSLLSGESIITVWGGMLLRIPATLHSMGYRMGEGDPLEFSTILWALPLSLLAFAPINVLSLLVPSVIARGSMIHRRVGLLLFVLGTVLSGLYAILGLLLVALSILYLPSMLGLANSWSDVILILVFLPYALLSSVAPFVVHLMPVFLAKKSQQARAAHF